VNTLDDGVFALLAFFFVPAIGLIVFKVLEHFVDEPTQGTRGTKVHLSQLENVCLLRAGPTLAELTTWSGRSVRQLGLFPSWQEALRKVVPALQRTQATQYEIIENTSKRFEIIRDAQAHDRKARGKKIGGAIITTIAE